MGHSAATGAESCVGSNNEGELPETGETAGEGFESDVNVIRWEEKIIEGEASGGGGVIEVDGEERNGRVRKMLELLRGD